MERLPRKLNYVTAEWKPSIFLGGGGECVCPIPRPRGGSDHYLENGRRWNFLCPGTPGRAAPDGTWRQRRAALCVAVAGRPDSLCWPGIVTCASLGCCFFFCSIAAAPRAPSWNGDLLPPPPLPAWNTDTKTKWRVAAGGGPAGKMAASTGGDGVGIFRRFGSVFSRRRW